MDIPPCIKHLQCGDYKCVCGNNWKNIEDTVDHMSEENIGFCINGLKRTDNDTYECLCGKKDMTRQYAMLTHFWENQGRCFLKALKIRNSYCDTCELQCESIAAYERHILTIKHKEKLNPTKLNLTCDICKITCHSQNQIKEHLETKKHKEMVANGKIAQEKIPLSCDICGIVCPSQKTIRAHLETKKHKKLASINDIRQSISTQ